MAHGLIESLTKYGVGRRSLDDELFKNDTLLPRLGIYDEDDEDFYHSIIETTCFVPGCKFAAESLLEFENHYNSNHRYACSICKKSQPSPHMLDLHIQETHDSFFAVMAERKPSFSCYIEECKEKFQNSELRLEHCVKVHKLPKDFRFDNKFKQKKKKHPENNCNQNTLNETPHNETNINLKNSKSRTFQKTFKKFTSDKKQNLNVDIDQVMLDLQESLPN